MEFVFFGDAKEKSYGIVFLNDFFYGLGSDGINRHHFQNPPPFGEEI